MTTQLPFLFGTVIAAAFVGVGLIMLARRYFLGKDASDEGLPFTLQDLREMQSRGEITSVEFESMRAAIIGSHKSRSRGGRTSPRLNTDTAQNPPPHDDPPPSA